MPGALEILIYFALCGCCCFQSMSRNNLAAQDIAFVLAPLFVMVWRVSGVHSFTSPAGSRLPVCEHCKYNLAGLAIPLKCPECGNAAFGTAPAMRKEHELRAQAVLESLALAAAATLLVSPLLLVSVLEACIARMKPLGLGAYAVPHFYFRPDQVDGLAFLETFLATSILVLPLAPVRSPRRALAILLGVSAGFAAALIGALVLEWVGGADGLSPSALTLRAAIWAGAMSLFFRYLRRAAFAAEARALTTAPSPVPTPPETASPSPPVTEPR